MSKVCGKCSKTVYPTELLNCLDKYWHKACFRCTTCNMTLNMKNYKGYDKLPYCNSHYPTTKFTAVADTPENRRISSNTKNQSSIQYHAEFERQKGNKVSVADDPETARIKHNTAIQSNVNYWGVRDARVEMERKRPDAPDDAAANRRANPGKISDYDPAAEDYKSPYSQRTSANVVYDSQKGEGQRMHSHRVQPGSIADYDPMNDKHSSIVRPSNSSYQPPQPSMEPPRMEPPRSVPAPPPAAPKQPAQPFYRAMYDYNAADEDEVSFIEGDDITNIVHIDEGWMTGTVKRTGRHGMLPSNYVEKA